MGEIYEFHIGTFDEPGAFEPTSHLFYPQRISWMEVQDDLPLFRTTELDGDPECHGPSKRMEFVVTIRNMRAHVWVGSPVVPCSAQHAVMRCRPGISLCFSVRRATVSAAHLFMSHSV
jgi:hypothetical protein